MNLRTATAVALVFAAASCSKDETKPLDGLRASSTPVSTKLTPSRSKPSPLSSPAEVKLESTTAVGTTILVPKGAKQLTARKTNAKWSLRRSGSILALEVELNKIGAKSEKDVRREANNLLLGTIESIQKSEDGRFHVVFRARGKLQKVATYTATHSVICDGPRSDRKVLDEICDSLKAP